jgi:hypothetical protein
VTFAQPITSDRVMAMRRLNDGQHIEEYSVKVPVNGGWKQVAHAHAIEHKKIDIFDPVTAKSVGSNCSRPQGTRGFESSGCSTERAGSKAEIRQVPKEREYEPGRGSGLILSGTAKLWWKTSVSMSR